MADVQSASLAPSESIVQFVIRTLLEGIVVDVEIDGQTRQGVIHQLDFYKGAPYVVASVSVPDSMRAGDPIPVRVGIDVDGEVRVLSSPEVR